MRRRLLHVVLASIGVNAALGIYALVAPHFGQLQGQVLATSACVTGAGVVTFACLPALERRRLTFVPLAGITASVLGFSQLVAGTWIRPDSAVFWKSAGTVLVTAGVAVLTSVLSLARLALRYRPVFPAAGLLAAVVGGLVVGAVWSGEPSETYGRVLGVFAVLLAAATVAVPILHRASRGEAGLEGAALDDVRFCPFCGRVLTAAEAEDATCFGCGAEFHVQRRRRLARPGRAVSPSR